MLLPRVLELLVLQHGEGPADAKAGVVGHDDVVDETAMAGDEGIGEFFAVLLGAPLDLLGVVQIGAEDDFDRALGSHDGDFGSRPGVVHIAAQMLRAHHVIGPAIGLARDHRDLGYGRLGEGEQQLGAVFDDAAVFLGGAGQEAGHIDEGDDGDVEAIAKTHEARRLAR